MLRAWSVSSIAAALALCSLIDGWRSIAAADAPSRAAERIIEWTLESSKTYSDPFNDVEVDVVFSRDQRSWRVPAFWRGGAKWGVRFAPPEPGEYLYRVESTDAANADFRTQGRITIAPYRGRNVLFRHGNLRVSDNHRFLEHADGTPFFWLGDTWWTGLSSRLPWEGFKRLTADRKAKGFTAVQFVVGLVPAEIVPSDPGCCNEGGCVWDPEFKRLNPKYFDYADRRIQWLLDNELLPVIVGGWNGTLPQIGVAGMKKHWRYIIARYGAYPVVWTVGGETFDPPEAVASSVVDLPSGLVVRGWTEVASYIKAADPYRHPLTTHEIHPPAHFPLQDEALTDFDLLQSGQHGWPTIAKSVVQLNTHYARTSIVKPVVQGEIGYEAHGNRHFEDFQRIAFWLSMLNGAAGHTYGADATWGAYSTNKLFHRWPASFRTWEEGMNLPGSYQVGLGAKLIRKYPWWRFAPHPEWVTPRGTTLLEPREKIDGGEWSRVWPQSDDAIQWAQPLGEWSHRNGTFREPYASGISREVRFIYIPFPMGRVPTVLGLESGVRYRAFYWDPSAGVRLDLVIVARPEPGAPIHNGRIGEPGFSSSRNHDSGGEGGAPGDSIRLVNDLNRQNAVAAIDIDGKTQVSLILRYQDAANYVAATYSPETNAIYLLNRDNGTSSGPLGMTGTAELGATIRLSAEVRGSVAAVSVTDGQRTYTTPIVDIKNERSGQVGVMHRSNETASLKNFVVRESPTLVVSEAPGKKLYDAAGIYRGDFSEMADWEKFDQDKHILLDAYRPNRLPTNGDWVLVLEAV